MIICYLAKKGKEGLRLPLRGLLCPRYRLREIILKYGVQGRSLDFTDPLVLTSGPLLLNHEVHASLFLLRVAPDLASVGALTKLHVYFYVKRELGFWGFGEIGRAHV
mgnify:CR=1 FL=1